MKKLFLFSIVLHISLLSVSAQKNDKPFRAYLYNNEYEVFMRLDLYGESITVPGQELYGELPGYLSKKRNSFCWLMNCQAISVKSVIPSAGLSLPPKLMAIKPNFR